MKKLYTEWYETDSPENPRRKYIRRGFGIAAAICLAAILLVFTGIKLYDSAVAKTLNDRVFRGSCINLTLTPEGETYLSSALADTLQLPQADVSVTCRTFENLLAHTDTYQHYSDLVDNLLLSYARTEYAEKYATADYLLVAEEIRNKRGFLGTFNNYTGLGELLDPEQKAQLKDCLYYGWNDGIQCIRQVEISGTPFARDCIESDGKVYLFFPEETVQEDRIVAFLEHILAWQSPGT